MNIIFLTLVRIANIEDKGIYTDLMRKFRDSGHHVYIISPVERRLGLKTGVVHEVGVDILNVRTFNVQKTSAIEKGLGTLLIEWQFKRAIKKFFKGTEFDLILYSTPPITFSSVVRCLKRNNSRAISYLLLKDIFPQNAVDLGMFSKRSFIYRYFRYKEKELYRNSDYIGCMSPANVDFLLKHNPGIHDDRVEVAPNSIELNDIRLQADEEKSEYNYIRKKYNLPTDRLIFIYGGNLGKPQGIDFLIKCLDAVKGRMDCHFVVVGNGTEYQKLEEWYQSNHDKSHMINVTIRKGLPKEDYDLLVRHCDVGLIFLDHRFSIPNYPSRLLSYLKNKKPVICATDPNTDIGRIAEDNGYGMCCESINPEDFVALVNRMIRSNIKDMGNCGYEFMKQNYLVEHTYDVILKHFHKL